MNSERLPIVDFARDYMLAAVDRIKDEHPKVLFYPSHVAEVERWAIKILEEYPSADKETVLLGVWFHDIGNLIGNKNVDHAIRSERITKLLLAKTGTSSKKIEAVAHCVRAHRNNDVPPQTIEARIVAAADSASHMTSDVYLPKAGTNRSISSSLAKLERDYRDIGLVTGLQNELTPLYNAWRHLLIVYPTFN